MRNCVICNKPFNRTDPRVLTCDPECSKKLWNQRRRERHVRKRVPSRPIDKNERPGPT
jgi:hypothetical protein